MISQTKRICLYCTELFGWDIFKYPSCPSSPFTVLSLDKFKNIYKEKKKAYCIYIFIKAISRLITCVCHMQGAHDGHCDSWTCAVTAQARCFHRLISTSSQCCIFFPPLNPPVCLDVFTRPSDAFKQHCEVHHRTLNWAWGKNWYICMSAHMYCGSQRF